jgi:hypothetical protein
VIVDPLGNSSDGTNWQASGVLGGTPGSGEQQATPGDFDADGDVDGRDFLFWQRTPSVGNLNDWRENYGVGELAAVSSPLPDSQELKIESEEPDSSMAPWAVSLLSTTRDGVPCYEWDSALVSAAALAGLSPQRLAEPSATADRRPAAEEETYVEQVDRAMETFVPVQRYGMREFGEMVARRTVAKPQAAR